MFRNGSYIGVPQHRNTDHIGVPNKSFRDLTLFLCKQHLWCLQANVDLVKTFYTFFCFVFLPTVPWLCHLISSWRTLKNQHLSVKQAPPAIKKHHGIMHLVVFRYESYLLLCSNHDMYGCMDIKNQTAKTKKVKRKTYLEWENEFCSDYWGCEKVAHFNLMTQ